MIMERNNNNNNNKSENDGITVMMAPQVNEARDPCWSYEGFGWCMTGGPHWFVVE